MDAVPLEKAPKVAVYAPPNAAPWDDAVTMALNYAGIKFEKIWDPEVVAQGLKTLRLAAPAPRGLHRTVLEVLPQLCRARPGWSRWWSRTAPWRRSWAFRRSRPRSRRWRWPSRGTWSAAGSSSPCAPRRRRSTWRSRPTAWTSRRPTPTARRWIPDATATMRWERALAFQDARLELSPTMPVYSDIDGHQVNSPDRRQPLGSFTLFNFSAKIDPVRDDAGAEPPPGDPRLLRPHHVASPGAR